MFPQVSFKFDDEHNKRFVIKCLKKRLKGLKYKIENEPKNVYKIYVASSEDTQKTLYVCRGINCFAQIDEQTV